MPNYFRAYPYQVLARCEPFAAGVQPRAAAFELLFVDEALAVRTLPFADAELIYDGCNSAWRAFCTETLAFSVPDWQRETEQVRAQLAAAHPQNREPLP